MVGVKTMDNAKEVYHIQILMDTRETLKIFIDYHEKLDIYLDKEGLYPVKTYSTVQNRGVKESVETSFNSDGKVTKVFTQNSSFREEIYQGPPEVQEGFSLFYYLRKWPWKNNFSLRFSYMSGAGKILDVNIKNPKKEIIKVGAGNFSCYYLKDPAIPCSVWISDDSRRIPVRIFNVRPFGIVDSRLVNVEIP